MLALALGRGLLVELARTQFGEQAGFLDPTSVSRHPWYYQETRRQVRFSDNQRF
ncbi:Uncharacterised protein [Bordetella pertussis]|nr:Uncharacterised protein [Bordetella pertussis]